MSANFRLVDRDTAYLLPPSVDDWLPEDHLARFVVEIVDQLDISTLEGTYTGSESDAYHPRMMLGRTPVRSRPAPGRCNANRNDEVATEDEGRPGVLRKAKIYGRAVLWNYKTHDGIPSIPFQRPGEDQW